MAHHCAPSFAVVLLATVLGWLSHTMYLDGWPAMLRLGPQPPPAYAFISVANRTHYDTVVAEHGALLVLFCSSRRPPCSASYMADFSRAAAAVAEARREEGRAPTIAFAYVDVTGASNGTWWKAWRDFHDGAGLELARSRGVQEFPKLVWFEAAYHAPRGEYDGGMGVDSVAKWVRQRDAGAHGDPDWCRRFCKLILQATDYSPMDKTVFTRMAAEDGEDTARLRRCAWVLKVHRLLETRLDIAASMEMCGVVQKHADVTRVERLSKQPDVHRPPLAEAKRLLPVVGGAEGKRRRAHADILF